MQKMGLKPFPGVISVIVKRGHNVLINNIIQRFTIQSPDCYKSPTSDTYVIFGEIKVDDASQAAQQHAAEKVTAPETNAPPTIPGIFLII